jgi:hypothetical protein
LADERQTRDLRETGGWGGVGGGAGKAGLSEAIHPFPTEMPEDPTAMRSFGMAVIPGGDEQLWRCGDLTSRCAPLRAT